MQTFDCLSFPPSLLLPLSPFFLLPNFFSFASQSQLIKVKASADQQQRQSALIVNFTLTSLSSAVKTDFQLAEQLLHQSDHRHSNGQGVAVGTFSSLLLFVFSLLLFSILLGLVGCVYRTLVPIQAARQGFQLISRLDDDEDYDDDDVAGDYGGGRREIRLQRTLKEKVSNGEGGEEDDQDDSDEELFNLQTLQRQRNHIT